MSTETMPDGGLSDEEYDRVRENVGDTLTRHGFDFDDWPDWHLDEFCAGLIRDVGAALAREHDAEWDAMNREIADLAAIVHGTSDAERALAVLDRLLQRPWPTNEVRLWRGLGGSYTACIHRLPDAVATGPTLMAALLALGARLEEGDDGAE